MRKRNRYSWTLMLALLLLSCVEKYVPEIVDENPDYLVVNGTLNLEGTTSIRLTRTTPITGLGTPPAVSFAVVTVESETGESFQLLGKEPGLYTLVGAPLSVGRKYRLRILADGSEYVSDFVPMKPSPPIDSVTFSGSADGLDIMVNTHDPSGQSQYYKWNYEETWEYRAQYASTHKLVNNKLVDRTLDDYRYICYASNLRGTFSLESTTRLTEDRVNNFTILSIPMRSEKVSRKYSILVRQTVLTEEGYRYWEAIKTSSEQVGGLFDPLPFSVEGNIRCVSDPSKKAIGFFSASSVSERRLFISQRELPESYDRFRLPSCQVDSMYFSTGIDYGSSQLVIAPIYQQIFVIGFTSSSESCVDCRVRGGVVTKPDFWE